MNKINFSHNLTSIQDKFNYTLWNKFLKLQIKTYNNKYSKKIKKIELKERSNPCYFKYKWKPKQ